MHFKEIRKVELNAEDLILLEEMSKMLDDIIAIKGYQETVYFDKGIRQFLKDIRDKLIMIV